MAGEIDPGWNDSEQGLTCEAVPPWAGRVAGYLPGLHLCRLFVVRHHDHRASRVPNALLAH
jgi:hypothetical protein